MLKSTAAAFCALALFPASANAVVGCPGQVRAIEVRSNGLVIGDLGYGWKGLCYLNQDANVNGVTTVKDSCTSWYAALLTGEATRQQVISYHNNASDCSTAMTETDPGQHWMAQPPYSMVIQAN